MTKEEIKEIFDPNRKFVPLREILSAEEMEDKINLGRILAIYDTYHIRKRGILETVYLFFSAKRKINVGIVKYRASNKKKHTRNEIYLRTKEKVLKLTKSDIYCKLVKANWFPSIYCGK